MYNSFFLLTTTAVLHTRSCIVGMHEFCDTYECVISSHTWMYPAPNHHRSTNHIYTIVWYVYVSSVTHMNESCHTRVHTRVHSMFPHHHSSTTSADYTSNNTTADQTARYLSPVTHVFTHEFPQCLHTTTQPHHHQKCRLCVTSWFQLNSLSIESVVQCVAVCCSCSVLQLQLNSTQRNSLSSNKSPRSWKLNFLTLWLQLNKVKTGSLFHGRCPLAFKFKSTSYRYGY